MPFARLRESSLSRGIDMSRLLSRILNWGFRGYVRRFVRKHFNAVRVSGQEQLRELPDLPVVCFINHPGWWDPMVGVLMTDLLFPGRRFAAPMDADALRKYPILERLGFFPVARDSAGGAKEFLRVSRQLMRDPLTILWLTPAGTFYDVRQPVHFKNGLSHIVDSAFPGTVLPMAIEYTFWNERTPELLVRFGHPVDCSALPSDREARTRVLENALASTQKALADRAIARDPAGFTILAMGRAGVGGLYDLGRRLLAGLRGQRFHGRHDEKSLAADQAAKGGRA